VDTPELTTAIEPDTLRGLLATGTLPDWPIPFPRPPAPSPSLVMLYAAMPPQPLRGDAAALNGYVQEFTHWTRQFPATIALKAALNLRGLKTGPFHVPLTPPNSEASTNSASGSKAGSHA